MVHTFDLFAAHRLATPALLAVSALNTCMAKVDAGHDHAHGNGMMAAILAASLY